ncbi:MAG: GHKL domain-containing protein [Ignavibacteriales bacterium]|jgi:signal transduction histidine kinase|nr:MAG: GHKL domain-containing protein [Ignavibacteriales bacterium]
MKKILISFVVFISLTSYSQNLQFRWNIIDSPINKSINLLKTDSPENFIITSHEGDIFHFINGTWHDLKISTDLKLNPFLFYVKNSILIASATDQKWHTHFFKRINNKWVKYQFEHDYPILKIFDNGENIYAIGAWGTFLVLEKSGWKVIDNPILNHIQQAAADQDGNIWLGVLSESVYKFNNGQFTAYPFEDNLKSNIYGIRIVENNSVEILTDNRIVYKFFEDRFIKIHTTNTSGWNSPSYEKFGFVGFDVSPSPTEEIKIEVPLDFKMVNHIFIPDSTIIIASRTGKIYIGRPSNLPQFINLAETYKIKGAFNSNPVGAAFVDINTDGFTDLFLFNGNQQDYSNFYLNNPGSPFTDGADAFKLLVNGASGNFVITDFNNDRLIDLVISTQDSTCHFLEIHENDGATKFKEKFSISLPKKFQSNYRRNLNTFDIDSDGDLDINISEYYGLHRIIKGGNFFIDNSWFGSKTQIDTSMWEVTSGWNVQTIFADFNSDESNELYIANEWGKNKLLFNYGGEWKDEAELRFKNLIRGESAGAAAFDFDNDGDLDIITISDTLFISLFKNDGKGFFDNVTEQVGLNSIFSPYIRDASKKNICLSDFNNDGFTDIFVTLNDPDTDRNYLMINQSGKFFEDYSEEYGIAYPSVTGAIAGDFDNDGDIDLFAFSDGSNFLWVNTLDNNNFIKIIPEGTISNKLGISAKIWLYEKSDDQEILQGYKQIGSDRFGKNQFNDLTVHFGVDKDKIYKVVVKFYGGRTVEKFDILPGSTVKIREVNLLAEFFYSTPGILYRFFREREVQYNLSIIVVTILLIYIGVMIGVKKFRWSSKSAIAIASINLFLFWVIYIASFDSHIRFIKYFVPLIVLGMSLLFTNIGFYWSSRIYQKRTSPLASDELFSLLRNFSHGEWASRNLNSLILFMKNWGNPNDTSYANQLKNRVDTYNQITSLNLIKIIELAGISDLNLTSLNPLSKLILSINNDLKDFQAISSKERAHSLALKFQQLKMNISLMLREVYSQYSCDPYSVLSEITENYFELFEEKKIKLSIHKDINSEHSVLIKPYELADIIDNLISNAVRSFNHPSNKFISIIISRKAPKIIIEVINNGSIISKNDYEKIFEDGYSKTSSSGRGLFLSRKILEKYGGSIKLIHSSLKLGTSFLIELHEGNKK